MNSELTKILPKVSKPTRYLGDELNSVRKDLDNPDLIRFALAFPDIYDVGMSHLGFKILYQILNSRDDVWAERAYIPWVDMEEEMRARDIPLACLESGSPLKEFDIVGFSLQYEMSYTNILNMLELAHIPLMSVDRDHSCPLIIAGGPCAFNPEPMVDFIDFFVIGDGEEVIMEIVDCYKAQKDEDRKKLLGKMADIEGVYVPLFSSVEEQPDGTLAVVDVGHGASIRKRVVADLNAAPYPVDYFVPFMKPIHDRAVIEVMRGCSRGCRFCQAGILYRPVRERSTATVENLAKELIDRTGYEGLSLASLSTCDHSSINEIVDRLAESPGKSKHVSISLPSLRADSFPAGLAKKLARVGKTGLTFAPEVATQRMQNVINKCITRDEVFSAVESAFSTGWDSLKLYFMIGLPTETEEDVAEIARFIRNILHAAMRMNKRASLNVSISTFVPKAHTPFQWERQLSVDEVQQRQDFLRDEIGRNRRLSVSFHSPQVSFLEGVFARGDRRLGAVLLRAHELGCKMDGWTEFFNFSAWMKAFDQCEIDPNAYIQARERDQIMPWDHIDTLVTKDFLLAELDRAYGLELTPDCRWGKCSRCGIRGALDTGCPEIRPSEPEDQDQVSNIPQPQTSIPDPESRIRFQFAKREAVKFISHLDLINSLVRAFRRARIHVAYSHGFNPHPKLRLGSGLPVGTTSDAEFADVDLETHIEMGDFISRSNAQLPNGLEILEAQEISLKERPLMAQINLASYTVQIPKTEDDIDAKIHSILDMEHIWIERIRKGAKRKARRSRSGSEASKIIDIRPLIRSIELREYNKLLKLEMVLGEGKDGKVRPEEVIKLILNGLVEDAGQMTEFPMLQIHKTGSFIEHQGRLCSPMEMVRA